MQVKSKIGSIKEDLLAVYDKDELCDATESVITYEKGKVMECECGQGFGVDFETSVVVCPTCGCKVFDSNADDREPPKRDNEQTSLMGWN